VIALKLDLLVDQNANAFNAVTINLIEKFYQEETQAQAANAKRVIA